MSGGRLAQRQGSCKHVSWEEQIKEHQPTGRQECANRQQEEEHLVSRLLVRAGNERWKGQAVQTNQEQRSCKRQEDPSPALRFPREQEPADARREIHQRQHSLT